MFCLRFRTFTAGQNRTCEGGPLCYCLLGNSMQLVRILPFAPFVRCVPFFFLLTKPATQTETVQPNMKRIWWFCLGAQIEKGMSLSCGSTQLRTLAHSPPPRRKQGRVGAYIPRPKQGSGVSHAAAAVATTDADHLAWYKATATELEHWRSKKQGAGVCVFCFSFCETVCKGNRAHTDTHTRGHNRVTGQWALARCPHLSHNVPANMLAVRDHRSWT